MYKGLWQYNCYTGRMSIFPGKICIRKCTGNVRFNFPSSVLYSTYHALMYISLQSAHALITCACRVPLHTMCTVSFPDVQSILWWPGHVLYHYTPCAQVVFLVFSQSRDDLRMSCTITHPVHRQFSWCPVNPVMTCACSVPLHTVCTGSFPAAGV